MSPAAARPLAAVTRHALRGGATRSRQSCRFGNTLADAEPSTSQTIPQAEQPSTTRRVLLPPRCRPEVRDPATGHQAAHHQAAGHRRAAFLVEVPPRRRAVGLGPATFLSAVRLEEERHAGQEAAAAAMLEADVTDAAALDHA